MTPERREQIVRATAKTTVEQRRGLTGKVNDRDMAAASAVFNVIIAPLLAERRAGAEQALRKAAEWIQKDGPACGYRCDDQIMIELLHRADQIAQGQP